MAAEAVLKVKEAEDQGKELIRLANEKAKQILAVSVKESEDRKKAILTEAVREREDKISAASTKAERDCEEFIAKGIEEKKRILSPEPARFDGAVSFIVERIVSADGNS